MRRDHARSHRTGPGRKAGGLTSTAPESGLPEAGNWIEIQYRRPHSGVSSFRQLVLDARGPAIVTFQPDTPIKDPVMVAGSPILAPGSPVIWFTIPGAWHDIGTFHLPDGRYTGTYANMLTPVRFESTTCWSTTDLYLDVWIPASGTPLILDEDELAAALRTGAVTSGMARSAEREAQVLLKAALSGSWPPAYVQEWGLGRAQAALERLSL